MNIERIGSCPEIDALLVKRIAGELSADEKNSVESHLAGCASCVGQEQELSKTSQKFDALLNPEIPTKLYQTTHETILGHLKSEKSSFPWIIKISEMGKGQLLFPFSQSANHRDFVLLGPQYGRERGSSPLCVSSSLRRVVVGFWRFF